MTRITCLLTVAATVIVSMAANVRAAEVPKEVKDWLKFSAGTWEVRLKGDDNNEMQPGIDSAELAAGGIVLITRGKQIGSGHEFVAVQAWEAAKKKLVATWYSSGGTHARSELEATKAELKGTISGTDQNGEAFAGTEVIKRVDENTMETTIEGELGGNAISFTIIATRKK